MLSFRMKANLFHLLSKITVTRWTRISIIGCGGSVSKSKFWALIFSYFILEEEMKSKTTEFE